MKKHQIFLKQYQELPSEQAQTQFLKEYMLRLSPDELVEWIEEDRSEVFQYFEDVLTNTQSSDLEVQEVGQHLEDFENVCLLKRNRKKRHNSSF